MLIHDYSDDLEVKTLLFDTDYFLLCLKNQVKLCFYPFFQFNCYPVLKLSSIEWKSLMAVKSKIEFEIHNRASLNDDLCCRLYLNILLIEIERIYVLNKEESHANTSRKHLITARFKKLVDKNFLTLRKVSDYVEKLYISPTYLNDTVKSSTGQFASEMIYNRLTQEIKGELILKAPSLKSPIA
ncbi:MAG: hypothetical protein AAGG68_14195 [Bacteroidota bacterium]